MTKPENDAELAQLVVNVQHIAASLDSVTRERGIKGLAHELSNLYAEVRKADWRAQEIQGPWWKRFL